MFYMSHPKFKWLVYLYAIIFSICKFIYCIMRQEGMEEQLTMPMRGMPHHP